MFTGFKLQTLTMVSYKISALELITWLVFLILELFKKLLRQRPVKIKNLNTLYNIQQKKDYLHNFDLCFQRPIAIELNSSKGS